MKLRMIQECVARDGMEARNNTGLLIFLHIYRTRLLEGSPKLKKHGVEPCFYAAEVTTDCRLKNSSMLISIKNSFFYVDCSNLDTQCSPFLSCLLD